MDVDKKVTFNYGLLISLLIVSIPMFGWKFWYSFTELSTLDALLVSFAKIGAFGGLAMFAMSLILSGRYVFYEKLFGGLDKMYNAHRFFGTMSLILLCIHPLALNLIVNQGSIAESIIFWIDIREIGIFLGAVALYGLIGLIVWTILTKSSYETFIKVHRILGLLFLMGALHAFILGSVLSESSFLRLYLLLLVGAGTVTFIFYSIFGDLLHRPVKYSVLSVKSSPGDIIEIQMKPKTQSLRFSPGQFVYINFPDIDEHQYHPFSIASGKNDSVLRLVVKQFGDFTKQLNSLKPDYTAKIKGPYGGFTFFKSERKKQLWIAGGIGVTPFLSSARSLKQSTEVGKIEMIYATPDNNPFGMKELLNVEHRNKSFKVTHFHQEKFGFISLKLLNEHFKDLSERKIFICGPPVMIQTLVKEAENLGLSKNLQYEEFSY